MIDYRSISYGRRIDVALVNLVAQGLDIETAIEIVAMAIPEVGVLMAVGRTDHAEMREYSYAPLADAQTERGLVNTDCPLPVAGVEPVMFKQYGDRFPAITSRFSSGHRTWLSADGRSPLNELAASATKRHGTRPAEYIIRYADAAVRHGLIPEEQAMWLFRCFSFGPTQLSYASRRASFDYAWYSKHVFGRGGPTRDELGFLRSFSFYLIHKDAAPWGTGPSSRPRHGDEAGVAWMQHHTGKPDAARRLYHDGDGSRRAYKADYADVRTRATALGLL